MQGERDRETETLSLRDRSRRRKRRRRRGHGTPALPPLPSTAELHPQAVAAFPRSLLVPVCRSTEPRPRAGQEAREEGAGLGTGGADSPLCRPELENYQTGFFLRSSLVLKFQS